MRPQETSIPGAREPEHDASAALTAWSSFTDGASLAPLAQTTNPIWRVDGGGPTLVLKQLPEYPPGVDPVVEFRVVAHLQSHGIPVALPVLTDAGALYASVDERRWVLLPYLRQTGARDVEPDPATAHAIGAAIGRLDRALAAYPWPVPSYVDDPITIIVEALPQLPADARELVRPVLDQLTDRCADLPTQLTHGDCNDGNILLDHGRVTGIIDLDHLPVGPRVRDLAYYLASRLRTHLERSADASALVDVLDSYVAGYQQAHPVTDEELEAVVPLMMIVEIGGAHWALNGWDPNLDSYERSLESLRWIAERFDQLTRSVGAS